MGQRILKRPLFVEEADTSGGMLLGKGFKAPTKKKVDLDVYADRLRNLVPAEVTAAYLAGLSAIPSDKRVVLVTWVIFCLVATILYTAHQTKRPPGASRKTRPLPVAKAQVAITAGSFLVWSYALGEPYRQLGIWVSYVSTLLMIGWTLVWPMVFSGEES